MKGGLAAYHQTHKPKTHRTSTANAVNKQKESNANKSKEKKKDQKHDEKKQESDTEDTVTTRESSVQNHPMITRAKKKRILFKQ